MDASREFHARDAATGMREMQPPETRGCRGWIDVSAVRPASTSQQTGDGDVNPHQPPILLSVSADLNI